jgi:hypothetical protein
MSANKENSRERALEWFNNLSLKEKLHLEHIYSTILITGSNIERIWKIENEKGQKINIYEEIKKLKEKNVYIFFDHDFYKGGSNCNFSIAFRDIEKQTGWFGDNHEFGDVEDVMVAAIKLANFLLSEPEYIKAFFSNLPVERDLREKEKKVYEFIAQLEK